MTLEQPIIFDFNSFDACTIVKTWWQAKDGGALEALDPDVFEVVSESTIKVYSEDYTKSGVYKIKQRLELTENESFEPIFQDAFEITIVDRNRLLEVDAFSNTEPLHFDLASGSFTVDLFTPPQFKYESATGFYSGITLSNLDVVGWSSELIIAED